MSPKSAVHGSFGSLSFHCPLCRRLIEQNHRTQEFIDLLLGPERDPKLSAKSVPPFCHDGTQRRIQRPKDANQQTSHSSGKKKCHTVKNVVCGRPGGGSRHAPAVFDKYPYIRMPPPAKPEYSSDDPCGRHAPAIWSSCLSTLYSTLALG
jgi:hypothetical protein